MKGIWSLFKQHKQNITEPLSNALKQNLKSAEIGEALLGLANTFEEQINPIEDNNLIPYFYNDNIFFSDSFELSSELSTENLKTSLAI